MESKVYIVKQIDGDYAKLVLENSIDGEEKLVARALLPMEISEGSRLLYEMLSYSLL